MGSGLKNPNQILASLFRLGRCPTGENIDRRVPQFWPRYEWKYGTLLTTLKPLPLGDETDEEPLRLKSIHTPSPHPATIAAQTPDHLISQENSHRVLKYSESRLGEFQPEHKPSFPY